MVLGGYGGRADGEEKTLSSKTPGGRKTHISEQHKEGQYGPRMDSDGAGERGRVKSWQQL